MRRYLPKGMAVWGELEEMGIPPWVIKKVGKVYLT